MSDDASLMNSLGAVKDKVSVEKSIMSVLSSIIRITAIIFFLSRDGTAQEWCQNSATMV